MKNSFKLTAGVGLVGIGAASAVVAFVIALLSCTEIPMNQMTSVGLLTVAGVILALGALYVAHTKGDGLVSTLMIVLSVAAFSFAIYQMVMGKSDVFGVVIFSDLEKGYAPAERATWMGVASIVTYLVSTLITVCGSFFALDTKK